VKTIVMTGGTSGLGEIATHASGGTKDPPDHRGAPERSGQGRNNSARSDSSRESPRIHESRHCLTANDHRAIRAGAFRIWREITGVAEAM
jgi:hypothetical protein